MTEPVRNLSLAAPRGLWRAGGALGVAVVALAIYARCVGFGLVWDDPVVLDAQLPRIDSIARAFFPPADLPGMSSQYYRPLVWLSYRADAALAGRATDPAQRRRAQALVFHGTTIVLHAAASALVLLFGAALLRRWRSDGLGLAAAAAGALLFAAHPIHVDSVAAITGRSDSLCVVFGLLASMCFVRHTERCAGWALAGLAIFTLCALLSKATGAGFLALFAAMEGLPGANRGRARASRWAVLGAVAAIYALLRFVGLSGLAPGAEASTTNDVNLLSAVGWYALKAFWPPPQSPYTSSTPGALAILGASVAAGFVGLVAAAWRRPRWRVGAALATLSLGTLAPALALTVVRISYLPVAERYLYAPTVGLCLLAGMLLALFAELVARRSPRHSAVAVTVAAAAVLAAPAAASAVRHSATWRDDISLWSLVVERAPAEGPPHVQLGLALGQAGLHDAGAAALRRAVSLMETPRDQARALSDLGSVLHAARRFDQAIVELERAVDADPEHWPARFNLAVTLLDFADQAPGLPASRARVGAAITHLEHVAAVQPRHAGARLQLGMAWLRLGRPDLARPQLLEAQKIAPDSPEARAALAALSRLP